MSGNIVSVDEESLKSDLRELVRKTVQKTLNALLDEEADEMVGAERYERTAGREAYRSGHCKRKLVTTSGEVVLDAPKLRGATFQTAVIERYRRRETSVEEAIIEMYLACVSTRRIEDVSELLWGAGVSAGTFPDGKSALVLVTARLKYIVENEWGRRRYLDVSLLENEEGKA